MAMLLVLHWFGLSVAIYLAEEGVPGTSINSYGNALSWGSAALSAASIADMPVSGAAQLSGGIWIVPGSVLFFGTLVATVTTCFVRRPHKKIIDTIEYNLEQLEDLSVDEMDLLRETVDTLIVHVERLKKSRGER